MELPKLTRIGRDQAGIAIVEVLVSALVLLTVGLLYFDRVERGFADVL